MANKIKVKLILELRAAHMSRNAIAKTRNISKNSVSDVIHLADKMDITFEIACFTLINTLMSPFTAFLTMMISIRN